jgi:hypothetical protein
VSSEFTSELLDRAIAHLQQRSQITVTRAHVRVSLGGCAVAHGTDRVGAMRRSAHAHTSKNDALRGWLCFKSNKPEVLTTPAGLPSRLLAHEWAHVAVMAGHTKKWRALMTLLGHKRDADKYLARVEARAKAVRWIALDPPLHMTDERLRELRDAAPAGHVTDMKGMAELVIENGVRKSIYGGGRWGYITHYRFVPGVESGSIEMETAR